MVTGLACLLGGAAPARAQQSEELECVMSEVDASGAARSLRGGGGVTLYLNRDGGVFTPGEPNDSRTNITSVPDQTVAVPPFDGTDDEWEELIDCVGELFAPFALDITEEDPGDAPHYEAVIGGEPTAFGLAPTVAGVSPFLSNCDVIDDSIVFVFPSVVGADPRRLCETVAQEVAHSFGLDHQYLCEDPMTYLTGCGEKQFVFQESVCGEYGPRACKCSRTQNSARLLLERVGRSGRRSLWLSRPTSGDVLAAGFLVQAVVTHTPEALELYVDGIRVTTVAPEKSGDRFQVIDFLTNETLRPGTHHVEVVALYEDEERAVAALVEVEGVTARELVTEGCAAGGAGGAGAGALVLVLFLFQARRRRSLLALALAAPLAAGCTSSVFGGGPEEIESGCRGAGEVSAAIGVLWSGESGTCTATLVAPSALITAAHCVAGAAASNQPIVTVLGGRQYIAESVAVYPDWQPGASADDVAAVFLTQRVVDVDPLVVEAEEPEFDGAFTLVGHGDWTPQDPEDAERQAEVSAVSDLQARSFSYRDEAEDSCLGGRGGGPALAGGESDRLLGLHGEDQRIMRVDQYACWLACAAGPEVPAASVPDGCDCTRSDSRPCNDCGAEFLDFASATWSPCVPAEELRPCEAGLVCSEDGYCVP
jgi:uncharacterized protein (TIGR03382 family)